MLQTWLFLYSNNLLGLIHTMNIESLHLYYSKTLRSCVWLVLKLYNVCTKNVHCLQYGICTMYTS